MASLSNELYSDSDSSDYSGGRRRAGPEAVELLHPGAQGNYRDNRDAGSDEDVSYEGAGRQGGSGKNIVLGVFVVVLVGLLLAGGWYAVSHNGLSYFSTTMNSTAPASTSPAGTAASTVFPATTTPPAIATTIPQSTILLTDSLSRGAESVSTTAIVTPPSTSLNSTSHSSASSGNSTTASQHSRNSSATASTTATPTSPGPTPSSNETAPMASGSVLWSGSGGSTFYYDVTGGGTCGPVSGITQYPETNGMTMCEPNTGAKTIAERGTNKIVAIANQKLGPNKANWCGKKLNVTHITTGQVYDDLFVWDGCEACNTDPHIDLSSTEFGIIYGESRCAEGEIRNEVKLDVWGAPWPGPYSNGE